MRPLKKSSIAVVVAVVVCGFVAGVSSAAVEVADHSGHAKVSLPDGWEKSGVAQTPGTTIGTNAQIEGYVELISESKEDIADANIAEYAEHVLKLEESQGKLTDRQVSEARKLEVNGMPAVQYEVRGTLNKLKFVYLKTFVETPHRWNQVMCWTFPSHWNDCQADFKSIYESLREIEPAQK
jgi:hypothetical protein